MPSTADSTSTASPTMWTAPVSSARTPDRNSRWSSTRNTRVGRVGGVDVGLDGGLTGSRRTLGVEGQLERHLGTLARGAVHLGAAPVPGHAAHDRLGDAAAVALYPPPVET